MDIHLDISVLPYSTLKHTTSTTLYSIYKFSQENFLQLLAIYELLRHPLLSCLQVIEWIREVGDVYLSTHTHDSGDENEADRLLKEHREFVESEMKVRVAM